MDEPLTIGDSGPIVERAQQTLGVLPATGVFNEQLAQRIRGLQMTHGLTPDGFLDDAVLDILERKWQRQ